MASKTINKKPEALEEQPVVKNEPLPGFFANNSKPPVVIDPGHGGKDPGNVIVVKSEKRKYAEADIARKITQKLIEILDSEGRVKAGTSYEIAGKEPDETWQAKDRLKTLNSVNKSYPISLLVSIHLNADSGRRAKGPRVLYKDDENSATVMYNSVATVMNKNDFGYKVPIKTEKTQPRDDLAILNSKFPSLLIEPGFLTNATDRKILLSEEGQHLIAKGIANAIYQLLGLDDSQMAMAGKGGDVKTGNGVKN